MATSFNILILVQLYAFSRIAWIHIESSHSQLIKLSRESLRIRLYSLKVLNFRVVVEWRKKTFLGTDIQYISS